MICLDEMGPQSAKTYAGKQPVRSVTPLPEKPAERAKQEADYGRRGYGYVFGAFRPATGDALTRTYEARTIANWTDFLGHVESWLPAACEQVYAILDNLNTHRAQDVLLFCLAHPRWEFCVPACLCRVPQPDRTLVEGAALARSQRQALRDMGADRAGR